ncbi:18660_t:CDS:2, partial [Gigaspora margarita]
MLNKSSFLNYIDEQNIRVINFNEFVNVSKVGKSGKVKKANSATYENSNKGTSLSDSENYPIFNNYPFERTSSLPDDFIDLDSYIIGPEHL